MRKIIQIMSVDDILHALCDDGTIWIYFHATWRQIDTVGVERR
jgi:hypothetical protein